MSINETPNDTQNPIVRNKQSSNANKRRRHLRRSSSVAQDSSTVESKRRSSQSRDAVASPVAHNDIPRTTTGGVITEQLVPSNEDDKGFLCDLLQRIIGDTCRRISVEAAQGQVELWAVCFLLIRMEQVLDSAGRPKRWAIDESIHAKRPPDGTFAVTGYAAKYLSVKCNQVFVQSLTDKVNVDVVDGLADTLKPILQPVLEAYTSGTLQLNEYSVEEGTAAIERQISKRRPV